LAARPIRRGPEALVEETTEGSFSTSDRQAVRRDHFTSVTGLATTIGRFCRSWNKHCQPFAWTRAADEVLAKLNRQTTSATEHQGDQRTIWPEGFDPSRRLHIVDSYRGNLALQD
jgi:hypothetical protein